MMDFLSFRRMLIPYLVQIVFWCGTAFCVFHGVLVMAGKYAPVVPWYLDGPPNRIVQGVVELGVGPIILRLLCELFVLFFRMNETLTEMSGGRGGKK